MANIWEKAISVLAGNLNFGCSYLITTVFNGDLTFVAAPSIFPKSGWVCAHPPHSLPTPLLVYVHVHCVKTETSELLTLRIRHSLPNSWGFLLRQLCKRQLFSQKFNCWFYFIFYEFPDGCFKQSAILAFFCTVLVLI